ASTGRLQRSHAERRDGHGGTHDQEHVRLFEQQHVADHVRIRQPRPRERESKHGATEETDTLRDHDGAPVNHTRRCANATAVPKNVIAATKLAGEPSDMPVSPWPDVQPPAVRAPIPITRPARARMPIWSAGPPGRSPA